MYKNKIIILLLLLVMIVLFFYVKESVPASYQPIKNQQNSCISCHEGMSGFSPAHRPELVHCNSCHLGNSNTFKKEEAHKNMLLIPGNLSNASQTCAKCHVGIDYRVKNSMMNTMSGIISVDKHVFGENKNLDSIFNIHHLKNESAAETHLRNKCASCHIGNEKLKTQPITEKSRGGGCTACHLNYSDKAKKDHKKYINSAKNQLPKTHPSLSLKVTDNHCFGCHSRSGRIATNYEGWHETIFKDTLYNTTNYRVLDDKRVFKKQPADIHHTKGMSCIDCHDSNDVMGDGKNYAHQENAVNVHCEDCHTQKNKFVETRQFTKLNDDEKRIIRLRRIDSTYQFIRAKKAAKNLINVIRVNDTNYLITKNTAQKIQITNRANDCSSAVHKNVACSTCHTAWAPQCISCHTSFDKNEDGYDLLTKEWKLGTWQEKGDNYLAEFPSLGVVKNHGKKVIKTFSPGMILSLEQSKGKKSFHRLFAPVSAHTISAKGKACVACHNNPVALGYGRGTLNYTKKGHWVFKSEYPKSKDKLPQDAWIGFLKNDTLHKATRKNARPFSLKEQQKMLRVGACLTCHKEKSKVVNSILTNFELALKTVSKQCVVPR